MFKLTYEESVNLLRNDPDYKEHIIACYLDKNTLEAATRFYRSEEFFEIIKILNLDKVIKKLNILDVGCGNGVSSYSFAKLGHNVYSMDPERGKYTGLNAAASLLKGINSGNINLVQASAESIPFKDESFDIVYARQVLHHFSDLIKCMGECSRVLKRNGYFFATREHVIEKQEDLKIFLQNHVLHKYNNLENAYICKFYKEAIEKSSLSIVKIFSHYESVINHYPVLNKDIKTSLLNTLQKRFGRTIGILLIKFPIIENLYRRRLSRLCSFPGNFNSFLCMKR